MKWQAGLTAVLAVGAHAGGVSDLVGEGMLAARSPMSLELRMDDYASNHVIVSRQATVLNGTGNMNMTAWDIEVNAACQAALAKLVQATNPSGTCTCYNLPVLNNATGAFEADLRLYQISAARDDFAGISQNQIQVSLSYNGASVSPVTTTTAAAKIVARQNSNPQLLQTYMFIGQIDQDKLTATNMNMASLERFVMPTVTLSATNSNGARVSTNVSSNEAVFLVGEFSNQTPLSTTAQAQIAVDEVVAGLANNTVAFVLPGVNLLIFPIGLIIASIWFTLGLLVIGFGFFERVSYREAYRRNAAIATRGATRRI